MLCSPACQNPEGSSRKPPTAHFASTPSVWRRVVWLAAVPATFESKPPLGSMPRLPPPVLPPSNSA